MKKIMVTLLSVCLCVVSMSFVACSSTKESKVMNVSLNPEVEFILDENDKVVSVNALNEEGNLVINGQVFVGKSSEDALKLYVSVCKETGFLVTGNVKSGENEISISFSGEDAQKYYNDMKKKAEEIFSEENITATVKQGVAITEAYINDLLEQCAPYVDAAKIEALSYMEKVEMLASSRKETAEMYSQQLKDAYYQAKADAFNHAKFEAVKANVNSIVSLSISALTSVYDVACATLETTRKTLLVDETSPYQLALVAFREAKTAYLNFRNYVAQNSENSEADLNRLESLKSALDNAEQQLISAGVTANETIDALKTDLTAKYDAVVSAITSAGVNINEIVDNSETEINNALTSFETNFAASYESAKTDASNAWNAMKDALSAGQPTFLS